jgi:hypothetical protein
MLYVAAYVVACGTMCVACQNSVDAACLAAAGVGCTLHCHVSLVATVATALACQVRLHHVARVGRGAVVELPVGHMLVRASVRVRCRVRVRDAGRPPKKIGRGLDQLHPRAEAAAGSGGRLAACQWRGGRGGRPVRGVLRSLRYHGCDPMRPPLPLQGGRSCADKPQEKIRGCEQSLRVSHLPRPRRCDCSRVSVGRSPVGLGRPSPMEPA